MKIKLTGLVGVLTAIVAASGQAWGGDAENSPIAAPPTNGLVFNFDHVPLNAVLSYVSEKTGLIVISETDLSGNVSIVSKQTVTTNEVVDLLNSQLAKNNYTAILNGRMLTIMDAARAKTSASTPVLVNNRGPDEIPVNEKIVTEILPLQTVQAGQLLKDLGSLIPAGDTVTANESGNSIIMIAPQKDIHRISKIIAALDSSSVSDVAVFVLRFADAKAVAAELKELFRSADSNIARGGNRNSFGGPGGFGPPGFGGDGGGNTSGEKNSQTHTVFASDDQLNAVIVSAPAGAMALITNVIAQLDVPVQGVTQMRVFKLKHADPLEVAEELSSLFPSSTSSSDQNNRSPGFDFNPFGQNRSADSTQSSRTKGKTAVVAVADRRTESVIVTASAELMLAIGGMIASLDEGNQGVTHVTAIPIEGADAANVQQTLAGLFSSQTSASTTTTSALSARTQADNTSQSSSSTSTTSGFQTGSSGTSAGR